MEIATIDRAADTAAPNPPTFSVEGKQIGKSRALFPARTIALPAASGEPSLTLRDLIALTVRGEVDAYTQRQADRAVVRALTATAIADGAARGKIDMGGARLAEPAPVEGDAAVETALQAFADGLYYVFVDDQQIESLQASVALKADSRVMFLRLVALAGG